MGKATSPQRRVASQQAERFSRDGHLGPIRILNRAACRRFLAEVTGVVRPTPLDWEKGWAAASRPYYALGCHPTVLALVTELLGDDVLLWGAMLVRKGPGVVHAWHSDAESSHPQARTVSVWLGLENCGPDSSLQVISGSHRHGVTIQELRASAGTDRATSGPGDVLGWAQERAAGSQIQTVAAHDGEAVFFDGRLWHGSDNRSSRTRTALLLQYATPDTRIRIPRSYDWPFGSLECPRPPCVLVTGEDHHQVNRIIPGPVAAGAERGPRLTSQARPLTLPLAPDPTTGFRPYPIFHGTTAGLRSLTCHVSALVPGHSPHLPHQHDEEELLMVLGGEADVLLPALPEGQQRQRLHAGDLVYYPAQFPHAIEGAGEVPANYLMLKWLADPTGCGEPLAFARFSLAGGDRIDCQPGFHSDLLFEGPTRWLHRLHAHLSTMAPGAGYAPHADGYDVALIVLEGELESLDQALAPHGVFFYPAGELHGARNPGAQETRYVVFEFHSRATVASDRLWELPLWRKALDPRRWRHKLGRVARRLRPRRSP